MIQVPAYESVEMRNYAGSVDSQVIEEAVRAIRTQAKARTERKKDRESRWRVHCPWPECRETRSRLRNIRVHLRDEHAVGAEAQDTLIAEVKEKRKDFRCSQQRRGSCLMCRVRK